jgi:uncharacterized membrane protein YesL
MMALRCRRKPQFSDNLLICEQGQPVTAALLFFYQVCYNLRYKFVAMLEVRMIWQVFKQSAFDIWDELLHVLIFNLIWCIGTLLVIPWPFVTFALYEMAYDVGEGKGLKYDKIFSRTARGWKQAYLWGGINLIVVIIIWFNFIFYANFQAWWSSIAQLPVVGFTIFWVVTQLIVLPIYPRLEEPGFKLALRNAIVLTARHPLLGLILVMVIATMAALSVIFIPLNWFILLGLFSFSAILSNRVVKMMVARELGDHGSEDKVNGA